MSKSQQQVERKVAGAGIVLALVLAGTVGAALVSNSHHSRASDDDQSIASAVTAADPGHPASNPGLLGPVTSPTSPPTRPTLIARASGDPRLASGFGHLNVAPALVCANLAVYPVYRTGASSPAPVSLAVLDSGMSNGTVSVIEPSLSVTNTGPQPTYVPGGEVVPGGNQDQGVANDAIVPPQAHDVAVASFCVEPGRSFGPSPEFHRDVAIAIPAVRYAMAVTGDQQQVWNAVAAATDHFGAHSETGTYHALMQSRSAQDAVQSYQSALTLPVPQSAHGQVVGAVVAINGKIVCADVYRDPALFAQLWPSLLRSYALQAAMHSSSDTPLVSREAAAGWLAALDSAPGAEKAQTPGMKTACVSTPSGAGIRAATTGDATALMHEAFWTQDATHTDG